MSKYPYGIIGNCTGIALVSKDASIDWCCMPYFDSPSIFARILDKDQGGSFRIEGINTIKTSQEYVRYTPILRTRIETADGVFDVYDFMPRFLMKGGNYYCPAELQRNIRVISGAPKIRITIDLKPNYAAGGCETQNHGEYLKFLSTQGEYHSFYLYTSLNFDAVTGGKDIELPPMSYLVLSYHQKIRPMDYDRNYVEFERTKSYWLGWAYRTRLPQRNRDMVLRSMMTLKLLMYQRTGAVIAAATTSLPEVIGKDRNWDYRYCWIRDASMIVEFFARLGHVNSSSRYMDFILNQMLLKHDSIAVMYGINGEKILTEEILGHLQGYENSSPVRIGNDAYRQSQNDLYGELIDAIYTYFVIHKDEGVYLDQELWTVVRSLINHARAVWDKPDNGIWEYRSDMQHHVFSKLMNWVAMDRAGRLAKMIGRVDYAQECFETAELIRDNILKKGWNKDVRAFTMYYGSSQADAAILQMLHYGFLKPEDPQMKQTVEFCGKELIRNGFVMRYTGEDDFGRPENAFMICTFWMINALYLTGRKDQAREMFNRAAASANHLGLFSEGIEPQTGRQTGNFPQGYSHMAFIQSALLLETDDQWGPLYESPQTPVDVPENR